MQVQHSPASLALTVRRTLLQTHSVSVNVHVNLLRLSTTQLLSFQSDNSTPLSQTLKLLRTTEIKKCKRALVQKNKQRVVHRPKH